MDSNDIFVVKLMLDKNVKKMQAKLNDLTRNTDVLCKVLCENVSEDYEALHGFHNVFLSKMSGFNKLLITWNKCMNENNLEALVANSDELLQRNGNKMADARHISASQSALTTIQPDSLSLFKRSSWLIKPDAEIPTQKPKPTTASAETETTMLPISPRKRILEPPKGGKTSFSSEIYHQIVKNMAAFPVGSVIKATILHLNMAEHCFFVGMWDAKPLQKLLKGNLLLKELDQLPNFGEIFAMYDCIDGIFPRVTINDNADGGGYDAYLIDYGEHVHLNGYENIFALPDEIRLLPAEAIRCFFREDNVSSMTELRFESITFRVLETSGDNLIVELTDETAADSVQDQAVPVACQPTQTNGPLLSEADMAMLNEIDEGTSDPLKDVLGVRPKDEKRICRHYDPKLNGCFKGRHCRLVHEPFAPHGATKGLEVADPLPETVFDTLLSRELGSTVKILITHVISTTAFYAQFVDGSPPLVWTKDDVLGAKSQFKKMPHMLDIVLACYNDGYYYRAQVIGESDEDYEIFYVDYGNTQFVSPNALAPCGDSYSLRPFRAVRCYINGVTCRFTMSPKKAAKSITYLKSEILNVEYDVVLVGRMPDGFAIQFLGDQANLPEKLMMRGYAQPEDDSPQAYDSDYDQ